MRTHTDEVVYDGTVRIGGTLFCVRICRTLITCHDPARDYVMAEFHEMHGRTIVLSVSMPWVEFMSMNRATPYRTWPAMLQAMRDLVQLSGKVFPCTLGQRVD